ncbi:BRD4-interacting chromatin-remodeling complex-associated protein-like [Pelobates fuscus]|uniref:BRD4-interacting chromatin-remodeling complex-associated protein-like n=1 Tax=Pelobates fuscus TaxID=191477 RepID=UPI002FE48BB0
MDDDDDSGLLDLIGDPQALNFFLHGGGSKSAEDELMNADFSSPNSNSIFAHITHADPKSSIKSTHNPVGEGSNDGLQLSSSLQFLEDELESSSMPDLSEDILQKSLEEANITEQILAEEAYLDASVGSGPQFSNVSIHSHSSASFTQASNVPNYSGQSLHSVGVTHVPLVQQQVGTSFASNTVGVQHGFMQQVGIIPNQHMSNSNHSGSGQIHVISSINNQSPVMTINNLDGSHIILKSGQQASANAGLMVHRQTPNGNAMFGSPNASPGGQSVAVPFNSGNFHTSLPVHNIIIHRGSTPNTHKAHINIQPKPMQIGQQTTYNVHQIGVQQHHVHQGVPFASGNPPQSSVGQQMAVNQQGPRNQVGQHPGGSIVIHSSMGQSPGHPNQFVIPTGLSVNSGSVQHIQTINNPLVQSHLNSRQLPADHLMLNRNAASMVRHNQPYSGQMVNSQGTAVQLVPGQTFTGPGGQVILNHGQMSQISPTVLHLSPGQSSTAQTRSTYTSVPHSGTSMSVPNRFTVVGSNTVLQNMGPSYQTSARDEQFVSDQHQNRTHSAMNESHVTVTSAKSTNVFCTTTGSQQTYTCSQVHNKVMNHQSPVSSMKTQDGLRQPHMPGHNSGSKQLHESLTQQQEQLLGSPLQNMEVDVKPGLLKRPASRQLTKETLILQQLRKDQEQCVLPNKSQFQSLNDAIQRLLPYHVFQGSLPTEEDLKTVDDEFEAVATHLLKKTQAMLNKYRLLLLEDAMRINPSAEMVMLDRIFNQEERAALTREKRMSLVDPDGFLTEFCCASKHQVDSVEEKEYCDHSVERSKQLINTSSITDIQKGKTDLTEPRNHEKICVVPDINVTSCNLNVSSVNSVDLNKDDQKKTGDLLRKKQSNMSRTKLEDNTESSVCPSQPGIICKTSKEATNTQTSCAVESKKEMTEVKSLRDKSPWPSPESGGESKDSPRSPGKRFKGLNETLKATVKNALELKLGEMHLQKEVSSSSSAKGSPTTTEESCAGNAISDSDSREGTVETDSVLEAAVNSILEC